ncbi:HD-GYP domain-containing protein [Neptunicella sp. SCSIO 80796]|uniref:HD-GYP domain-containing protein n=1 Tax=Neptunicella plasticusilytica TaxID=3117012 RepID=UPI003A4D6CD4
MIKVISIQQLVPGMYVTRITQPKNRIKVTSTGLVKTIEAVGKLKDEGVLQLEIDLTKSQLSTQDTATTEHRDPVINRFSQKMNQALDLYAQTKVTHSKIIQRISKGKYANLDDIEQISSHIIDNIFECEEIAGAVTQIRQVDQYLLEHSVNCAILISLFARHLNFDRPTIHQLGTAALLMDIGMAKLPLLLTQKRTSLNDKETRQMQAHVDFALELVRLSGCVGDIGFEVIQQHHERLDGSGYPAGLAGEQISIYARMAAIVDTYDSLTAERPYRQAMAPADALRSMLDDKTIKMDPKLMDKFAECINLYPVGSVVKLQSGKLAMVLRANPDSPLTPLVMSFYDIQNNCHEHVQKIDLSSSEDLIVSSILPEDFNLNMLDFFKQAFDTTSTLTAP